jgi:3-hydroxyisobutyrate dehydrogenase-like beta-hydroxyacid dehydrogenase
VPAGFAVPLGHKDIRLTRVAAEGLRVPVRLANRVHGRFLSLGAQHGDARDWSAMGVFAATDAADP